MKTYLVLVREPDGRTVTPSDDENRQHQLAVRAWIGDLAAKGHWESGNALTLSGKIIRPTSAGPQVVDGLYQVNGQEIVGGYLLIKAADLDEAANLLKTCPILDVDGFLEIRETM